MSPNRKRGAGPSGVTVRIDVNVHRALSIQAALQGREISDLAEELIAWALENKPEILRWELVGGAPTKKKGSSTDK